jgi:hypothetical protein
MIWRPRSGNYRSRLHNRSHAHSQARMIYHTSKPPVSANGNDSKIRHTGEKSQERYRYNLHGPTQKQSPNPFDSFHSRGSDPCHTLLMLTTASLAALVPKFAPTKPFPRVPPPTPSTRTSAMTAAVASWSARRRRSRKSKRRFHAEELGPAWRRRFFSWYMGLTSRIYDPEESRRKKKGPAPEVRLLWASRDESLAISEQGMTRSTAPSPAS